METNTNPLRIPSDPYEGYAPYVECPFEPIYPDILYHPIFADGSFDYRLGFEVGDNRYFSVLPERMDVDALYSDHWYHFMAWARGRHSGLATLPAAGVTVGLYITEVAKANDGAEARIAAEAIHTVHSWALMPSPLNDGVLQVVTKVIERKYPPVNHCGPVKPDLNNPAVC